ncbi:MAG: hypothetical protein ACT4PW_00085 [Acidimicrobiia bacterium]
MSATGPRRPWPLLVAAAAALLVGAGCRSGSASGYGEGTEAIYLRACNPSDDANQQRTCRCAYDEIRRTIPFERYREMDEKLVADRNAIPDEVLRIVADCASRPANPPAPGAPPTTREPEAEIDTTEPAADRDRPFGQ